MSTIKLFDTEGNQAGDLAVPEELRVIEGGEQAVQEVVTAMMAARRAGTASTLSKGEVAGSNRKPWRQKGTGRARAGYRQSPVWRGGGVAFGPHPRDYSKKVNRKTARLALRRALSDRLAAGDVSVIEEFTVPEGKTRVLAGLLRRLGIDRSCLLVAMPDELLRRAARNLSSVALSRPDHLDVYTLLRYRSVVMTREAYESMCERTTKGKEVSA